MAEFKVTIPRLLARLEEVGKAGATLAELAQALDVAVAHVSGAVCQAEKQGLTGWHYHPSATSSNRKRWWNTGRRWRHDRSARQRSSAGSK